MIDRHYEKEVDCARLTSEIVAAGLPCYPNTGARFYGVVSHHSPTLDAIVMLFDDITQDEIDDIDTVVAAHIPIPMPDETKEIKIQGVPQDEAGKLFTRAESRPLDCTTFFTSSGDTCGDTPSIGTGTRMFWDASVADGWVDDQSGAPEGTKQFSATIQFCDSVWIKEGALYYMNASKGSYADMQVICPNGYYFMYLGQVYQNTTGNDLIVDHYLNRHPLQGDVPMGDELNTETCSQELPSYLKYKFTVTVPEGDTTSYGCMEIELYRKRTVILDLD